MKQSLQLRLGQHLTMTPQLQQAIRLLQLNRLELATVVQQELEENPVLEEMEGEDEPAEARSSEEVETAPEEPAEPAPEAPEAPDEHDPTDAEKIADIDWQNYMEA